MTPFTTHTGIACPLPLANVDTDQIIPARFLQMAKGAGYGEKLLYDLRVRDGAPIAAFPLNRAPWAAATIIVARRNFGCGSSREAAVYALAEFGIRAVLAPTYGDIFAANAVKNGLVAAIVADAVIEDILAALEAKPDLPVTVDLTGCTVAWGNRVEVFAIDPVSREQLLDGLDDLAVTRAFSDAIDRFKLDDRAARPWLRPAD